MTEAGEECSYLPSYVDVAECDGYQEDFELIGSGRKGQEHGEDVIDTLRLALVPTHRHRVLDQDKAHRVSIDNNFSSCSHFGSDTRLANGRNARTRRNRKDQERRLEIQHHDNL